MEQFSEPAAENKVNDLTPSIDTQLTPKRKKKRAKPDKDFPLWLHPSGRWCRKFKGRVFYFGKADNPQAALEKWLDQKDEIFAGRTPRVKGAGLLVGDPPHDPKSAIGLVNRFLNAKLHLLNSGEITKRTYNDYKSTCQRLVDEFGWSRLVDDLDASDFEKLRASMTAKLGAVALGNEIGRVRVVFKFAVDNHLVPGLVRYGQSFRKPSRKSLRVARVERGSRSFDASEIRRMLDKSTGSLRAMILLGINAGLGQADISSLPITALDLQGGWLNYPRPKTGIARRCWLWPQTRDALREVLASIPRATDPADSGLVFVTKYGARWCRTNDKGTNIDGISQEFRKLLAALGINGLRGFYCFRRTFETIGGGARDQVAVDSVMGHAPASGDMGAVYRQSIDDDRLKDVAEHVRRWLFPRKPKTK